MIYGYTRVSTLDQASGTSLHEQERKIKGLALVHGADEPSQVQIYRDEGVSGSVPLEQREQGGYLLDVLAPGDLLIVAKLDRAFRSAEDALRKASLLKERGIDLVIADIGQDPVTHNGAGKLFFTLLAAMAEFERERILERTREGRHAKRSRGGYIGGNAPFGYRVAGEGRGSRLVPVPEEQEAVRTILEARAEGLSLRAVAALVQERHGLSLSHTAVKRVELDANETQEA